MPGHTDPTSGVYVDLNILAKMEHRPRHFNLLPHQPAHSVLAGDHGSRLRGRGLDFLELRAYQAGDDVRSIDWRVTARARKPYTRIFTEERERPTLLIVDQRQTMFFGSTLNMKSVTAAEIAAMAIWAVLSAKDRIGAVIFNDSQIQTFHPQRSRGNALRILKSIADLNRSLSWTNSVTEGSTALNNALRKVAQLASHDFLICLISDGAGIDAETRRLNSLIARHNDLIFAYVYDPLEVELPEGHGLIVGDGARQMEVASNESVRRKFRDERNGLLEQIRRFWINREVPVLSISAAEPTGPQLRRLLTIGAARRRRR